MIYRPVARVLSITGLCVALIAPPVSSQTEAVELQLRLKAGESLRYTVVQSSLGWGTVDINGVARTFLNRESATMREEIRANAVGEDGTLSLEVTQQETRTTRAGGPAERPRPHLTAKVRPNGEIVKDAGALGPGYFPIGLPDRAVSPGESWTYKQKGVSWDITEETMPIFATDVTFSLTLVGVDRVGEERVARVQIRGEGLLNASAVYSTVDGTVAIKGTSPLHVTGEASWSIDGGRLVRLREEASYEIPLEVTVEGRTFQGKYKFTLTEEREPAA